MTTIRQATEKDITEIADIHMKAFPGFFLTMMGKKFLKELYRDFIVEKEGTCIVAEEQKQVVGFAAGTMTPESFFTRLRKRRWHVMFLRSFHGIFRRPLKVTRMLFNALFYKGDPPPKHGEAALLSSIAVDPDFSGKGTGKLLLDAFCEIVRNADICYVYLLTDQEDNERTRRFYEEYGFELESTMMKPGKRLMNRYLLRLTEDRSSQESPQE